MLLGEIELDSGEIWIGPSFQFAYYAQQHETLDMGQTPIEALHAVRPTYEGEAVAKLGRFLIPYAACSQPIAKLSRWRKESRATRPPDAYGCKLPIARRTNQ